MNRGATTLTNAAVLGAVRQNLSGGLTGVASGQVAYRFNGELGTNSATVDTLTSIENGTLADGINYVVGSAEANVIVGGSGVDTIVAGNGADTITGGDEADVITLTETAANSAVDTLIYRVADESDATDMDSVTGFSAVDVLDFDTTADGSTTDDAAIAGDVADEFADGVATGALATAIAADASLSDALTEFLAAASFDDNDVAAFVYGGDSYVVHADDDGAAGNIVKLVGVNVTAITESNDTFTLTI